MRTPGESVLLVLVRTQTGEEVAAVPPAKQALKAWDWHLSAQSQEAVPGSFRSQERRLIRVGWERQEAGPQGSSSVMLPSWTPTHRARWNQEAG